MLHTCWQTVLTSKLHPWYCLFRHAELCNVSKVVVFNVYLWLVYPWQCTELAMFSSSLNLERFLCFLLWYYPLLVSIFLLWVLPLFPFFWLLFLCLFLQNWGCSYVLSLTPFSAHTSSCLQTNQYLLNAFQIYRHFKLLFSVAELICFLPNPFLLPVPCLRDRCHHSPSCLCQRALAHLP